MPKPKILVEIVGGAKPIKKKCEIKGNEIILQKEERKGGAEITATYDNSCLVPYYGGFPRALKFKLILRHGADKCVSFAEAEKAGYVAPGLTREGLNKWFKASVLRNAGNVGAGENKTLIYALIIINIVLSAIGIALAAGVIQF